MVEPIYEFKDIKNIQDNLFYTNKRNYLLFVTGINTGLRISDILRLKVKDVRDKDEIRLRMKKTRKLITIEINSTLKKQYKKVLNEDFKDEDFLIKSSKGYNRAISRTQAYRILKAIGEKEGLKHIGTHSLRKTYGYYLYETCDKDIGYVQTALGHSDPKYTLRYIGINNKKLTTYINNLGLPE